MKLKTNTQFILMGFIVLIIGLNGCLDAEEKSEATGNSFILEFSHFVSEDELKLGFEGSKTYPYSNFLGQTYNITQFGYYISGIELLKSTGEAWVDPVKSSIHADEVKGFYHIQESIPESKVIHLENIDNGTYTHVKLNIGIPVDLVKEGAQGGILDIAEGAWFWNWNNGYITMKIEGQSPESPALEDESHIANSISYHVGGWSDPNNVKEIVLELPQQSHIENQGSATAHIVVDVERILNGAQIDFSQNYHVHMPMGGVKIANQFEQAFMIHHIH